MATVRLPSPEETKRQLTGTAPENRPAPKATKREPDKKGLLGVFVAGTIDDMIEKTKSTITNKLIPDAEKAIIDTVYSGINLLMFGQNRKPNTPSGGTNHTNYTSYSNPDGQPSYSSNPNPNGAYRRNYTRYTDTSRIIFNDLDEAEVARDTIYDVLEQFQCVSVAKFCEIAGVDSEYTDVSYGWENLPNALEILPTRENDGYFIRMPRPVVLSKRRNSY